MKYFKPFKEDFSSEEYYEKVYPVSGCIFATWYIDSMSNDCINNGIIIGF